MRALNRKLYRDLGEMRSQALAICMVIAAGVATYVMSISTLEALKQTRATYYQDYRFADVFASLKRAPNTLVGRIAEIPGVGQVQTRVIAAAQLDLPGFPDPVTGRIVSVPEHGEPLLNAVHLRRGRMVDPVREDEVLVGEAFAEAHAIQLGDTLSAVIRGRKQDLRIVGIALSPEYIYQIAPGRVLPDYKRYAVLWMGRRPLEAAYEMEEAFNDIAIGLTADGSPDEVIDHLDLLLEPNGGIGAILYDGETSLKRVFYDEYGLRLEPANPDYEDIHIRPDVFEEVRVLGRYVGHVNHTGIFRGSGARRAVA